MSRKKEESEMVPVEGGIVSNQGKRIMEAMNGDIPPHAILQRPGRGGKVFNYISHGYVADQLNRTFGCFWDKSNLPLSNGQMYEIITYLEETKDGRPKEIKEVIACVRITIRLYGPDGTLLETIVRDGDGGKVWEKNTTFADALQSARSDAFKRAAFTLGTRFGLQLYYDDEELQDLWVQANQPREFKTVMELISYMMKYQITDEQVQAITGISMDDEHLESRLKEMWPKLEEFRRSL